jgi:hypothetical protein
VSDSDDALWWRMPKDQAGQAVWGVVRRLEENQSEVFDRLYRLEVLYDPYTPAVGSFDDTERERRNGVHENIVASNVDTVTAIISTAEIRPRVETDGGDWDQQLIARRLEMYAEEMSKKLDVHKHCRQAFKEAAKKGNGLVKYGQKFGKPFVQQVLVENVVVDQNETCDNRAPRQLHEWVAVDADELIAEFPKMRDEIEAARDQHQQVWRTNGQMRYIPFFDNQVVYLDSYRLPTGEPGYKPGRHIKSLEKGVLLDEKWGKDHFPYAMMVWSVRAKSWYGIGGAERIAGIQRALNRRNRQIEAGLDRVAWPTVYVRPPDAKLRVTTSRIGAVAVCHSDYPTSFTPQALGPETYQSRVDLKNAGAEEFGLSRLATHAAKPPGLDSAVALREFKDQTTDRYAPQEKDFEQLVLDTLAGVLEVCKDLRKGAPKMIRHGRFGTREIRWKDVDLGDLKATLMASSTMPRTPAGRLQFAMELAQAGIISTDALTRMLEHPDLEGELSLYTAAIDAIEESFDEIRDGKIVMPEPFMNAAMCVWRGQREYLLWRRRGAPEDRLEALRQFVSQAGWIVDQTQKASVAAAAAAGQGPGPGGPSSPPPFMTAEPGAGQPAPALSQNAVNLGGALG